MRRDDRGPDNVPVVSWLLLRGRCRRCGARISVWYPVLELSTAGLVVLAAIRYPDPWQAVLVAGLLALMPAIAVIDLRHRIIPNRLTYPALLVSAVVIVLAWLIDDAVDPMRGARVPPVRGWTVRRGRRLAGWAWAT